MRDEGLRFQTHKGIWYGHTEESHRSFVSRVLFAFFRLVYKSIITKQINPGKPNPAPKPLLSGYLMIQEHNLTKLHRRDLGEKSCALPTGRWCNVAQLPEKLSNAGKSGPAKWTLQLACTMETIRSISISSYPFQPSTKAQSSEHRRNTSTDLWDLLCI